MRLRMQESKREERLRIAKAMEGPLQSESKKPEREWEKKGKENRERIQLHQEGWNQLENQGSEWPLGHGLRALWA
jgi:hypothetical protein